MKIKYKPRKRLKYNNIPTVIDSIRFPSKKEANTYCVFNLQKQAGEILFFLMQVPFHLPGGVVYKLDFLVVYPDYKIVFYDVKGVRTAIYKLKKKQVEALYGITITEL